MGYYHKTIAIVGIATKAGTEHHPEGSMQVVDPNDQNLGR